MRHIKHPFLFNFLKQGRAISVKSKKRVFILRPQTVAHPGFDKGGATTGGLGVKPPAANGFLRFSYKKTLILAHFFIEKGRAVSAVTTDNAKIEAWLK